MFDIIAAGRRPGLWSAEISAKRAAECLDMLCLMRDDELVKHTATKGVTMYDIFDPRTGRNRMTVPTARLARLITRVVRRWDYDRKGQGVWA